MVVVAGRFRARDTARPDTGDPAAVVDEGFGPVRGTRDRGSTSVQLINSTTSPPTLTLTGSCEDASSGPELLPIARR